MTNELPMETISNGIRYTLHGDYYFPDFEDDFDVLGRWAQMHLMYIKENNRRLYCELLFSGKLRGYLETLEVQAQERAERMIQQIKVREGVNEALKAEDQMEWVRRMNGICSRVEEIVVGEMITV